MKRVAIIGAGQMGRAASALLNPSYMELTAFGDNNPALWTGETGIPVVSVEAAAGMAPDLIFICIAGQERAADLERQVKRAGFAGEIILLGDLMQRFDIRSATIKRVAQRLGERQTEGAIAELGVYKGATACLLNTLFPGKKLYLFDTFEGFTAGDVQTEAELDCSRAKEGDFSDTSEQYVLSKLPFSQSAIIRKGFFPDTAKGLEDEPFSFVSLDADLYAPTLAGLEFFYPRLVRGGMIVLHDYDNPRFSGVRRAVEEYERQHGSLPLAPLCDMHGSAVIIHP
jgi:O-methyltransferase